MEKITLSLHNTILKRQIKAYAQKRKLTVSGIVENYLQNLIKMEKNDTDPAFSLPVDLDILLDGIEVEEKLKIQDYKSLREDSYANRTA